MFKLNFINDSLAILPVTKDTHIFFIKKYNKRCYNCYKYGEIIQILAEVEDGETIPFLDLLWEKFKENSSKNTIKYLCQDCFTELRNDVINSPIIFDDISFEEKNKIRELQKEFQKCKFTFGEKSLTHEECLSNLLKNPADNFAGRWEFFNSLHGGKPTGVIAKYRMKEGITGAIIFIPYRYKVAFIVFATQDNKSPSCYYPEEPESSLLSIREKVEIISFLERNNFIVYTTYTYTNTNSTYSLLEINRMIWRTRHTFWRFKKQVSYLTEIKTLGLSQRIAVLCKNKNFSSTQDRGMHLYCKLNPGPFELRKYIKTLKPKPFQIPIVNLVENPAKYRGGG